MAPRRRKSRMIPQQPDRRANRTILLRTLFLMLVCGVCAFVPLFVKLYQIQIVEHEKYEQLAIDQQTRDSTVSASRGTIYDSKGTPLAMSYTVYNIQLSPRDIVKLQDAYQEAVETAREKGRRLRTTRSRPINSSRRACRRSWIWTWRISSSGWKSQFRL